jgi:hypothetical protein
VPEFKKCAPILIGSVPAGIDVPSVKFAVLKKLILIGDVVDPSLREELPSASVKPPLTYAVFNSLKLVPLVVSTCADIYILSFIFFLTIQLFLVKY